MARVSTSSFAGFKESGLEGPRVDDGRVKKNTGR